VGVQNFNFVSELLQNGDFSSAQTLHCWTKKVKQEEGFPRIFQEPKKLKWGGKDAVMTPLLLKQ